MNLPLTARSLLLALTAAIALSACVVYDPYAYSVPTQTTRPANFDRSWNAAQLAALDVDIQITSADRGAGLILGRRNSAEITINLTPQADGSLRIKFDVRNSGPQEQGLGDRFAQAYERRMGR